MKEYEPKRRGRKEKQIPPKNFGEYTTAELMRMTRQNAGKTLSETGNELGYNPQYLSEIEVGRHRINKRMARQYEGLFGCELGKIVNTIYERPHKGKKQQEPPSERK
jgi:transcriptional regulator with XRE-family HTH domain